MPTATINVSIDQPLASGQRRGWWKLVRGVDRALSNKGGYSIVGDFLTEGRHPIPVGSVLVRCNHVGSASKGSKHIRVMVVSPKGVSTLTYPGMTREELDLKMEVGLIHDLVEMGLGTRPRSTNPLGVFTNEELMAEMEARGFLVIRPPR